MQVHENGSLVIDGNYEFDVVNIGLKRIGGEDPHRLHVSLIDRWNLELEAVHLDRSRGINLALTEMLSGLMKIDVYPNESDLCLHAIKTTAVMNNRQLPRRYKKYSEIIFSVAADMLVNA